MGLRSKAESDLQFILEDSTAGFGWPIMITDPSLLSSQLTGFSDDISQIIDPDTGQVVSGRSASVVLRISSLYGAGFTSLPKGIADNTNKPWLIQFDDINGFTHKFKVIQSDPDRALGIVSCILEAYDA